MSPKQTAMKTNTHAKKQSPIQSPMHTKQAGKKTSETKLTQAATTECSQISSAAITKTQATSNHLAVTAARGPMSNQTISHLSKVSVNSCEKLRDTTHTDSKLSTNTEDANYVTPSKINPPAQQSDEPRSATDIVESRLATPRNSSIDRSMSAVCPKRKCFECVTFTNLNV